jgi:hypothetical protein
MLRNVQGVSNEDHGQGRIKDFLPVSPASPFGPGKEPAVPVACGVHRAL